MGMKTLRRRIERLEQSMAAQRASAKGHIWSALYGISQEELDLLIDAAVAERGGRALTESQRAARQSYATALWQACRGSGVTVQGLPEVADMVTVAVLRQTSAEDLGLCANGLRAQLQGRLPSESEAAALQVYSSTKAAQYQRAGFHSQAEFESWDGSS